MNRWPLVLIGVGAVVLSPRVGAVETAHAWATSVATPSAAISAAATATPSPPTGTTMPMPTGGITTAPTIQWPGDGDQLNGLEADLSWENPPGTKQVHFQLEPYNNDGLGLDFIWGIPVPGYVQAAPKMGVGPYFMLPGATYTWRVRATSSDVPVGASDPHWGPWSSSRSFRTRAPSAGTLRVISPTASATVNSGKLTFEWANAAADEFYYEIQVSADRTFNTNPVTATSFVYHNTVHGGESNPANSWAAPGTLPSGSYWWRLRQRVQGTPAGAAEPGIAWTTPSPFQVP